MVKVRILQSVQSMFISSHCYFKYTGGEFMQYDSGDEKNTENEENGLDVDLRQLNFLTYVTKTLQYIYLIIDYSIPHICYFRHLLKLVLCTDPNI